MNTNRLLFITCIIVLIGILLSVSCDASKDYHEFRLDQKDTRFSFGNGSLEHPSVRFDYPDTFKLVLYGSHDNILDYDTQFTQIEFIRNESSVTERSYIFVTVFKGDPTQHKGISFGPINNILDYSSNTSTLDSKEIVIAGEQGTYYKCQPYVENGKNLHFMVYFEHLGYNFAITMTSFSNIAEQVEKDFNQVITSFKFIE